MPIISVQMLQGRSLAQKELFIKKVCEVAVQTLNVPERAVLIVLTEVNDENWGVAGATMAKIKATPTDLSSI